MHETQTTVVGNVATPVDFRTTEAGVPAARFRLASTVRRFDREREAWHDAYTSFYTVWAWRSLAVNLSSSVSLGEPLVVHGRLRIREDERDGRRVFSAELYASAVGHDLARGTSAFARTGAKPETAAPGPAPPYWGGHGGVGVPAGTAGPAS
ncbi:single-stranded DNA-binding protein [Streptomyces sp. JJ36]|uniref:single-stranded DNA-binding protein n=1 Tax=Streptomyces sp. JJ36 TaxID=2736645 RepID=UPI001F013B6C|nr:single-stranded DNA-binding protein [Streptomyces sp. JJ36]MCF6525041.1 single-stranded DNA-binding protein [Streptomyces sp. JJ36]